MSHEKIICTRHYSPTYYYAGCYDPTAKHIQTPCTCIRESELLRLAQVSRTTFWRSRKKHGGLQQQKYCRGYYELEAARKFLVQHYHVPANLIGQERLT